MSRSWWQIDVNSEPSRATFRELVHDVMELASNRTCPVQNSPFTRTMTSSTGRSTSLIAQSIELTLDKIFAADAESGNVVSTFCTGTANVCQWRS